MKDANSLPGLISRYFRHPRNSFEKWFSSIPNLAANNDKGKSRDINHGAQEAVEPKQRYHDLMLKLQRNSSGTSPERERPRNGQQLQEAVSDIVRQGKEKMASAHSKEEILLEFIDGLYKMRSLL
jgi:hypothetical protein